MAYNLSERNELGQFIEGQSPPEHKERCSCPRCNIDILKKQGFKKKHGFGKRFERGHTPYFKQGEYRIENHPHFKGFRNVPFRSGSLTLKRVLIKEIGCCERCKISDFRVLVLHHKDRNNTNSVKENLELLCANCHAIEHSKDKKRGD